MLTVVSLYPELLGTYGDGGNALVLRERARQRGIEAEVVAAPAGRPPPAGGHIYLLGGGEDEPQLLAATGLRTAPLASAVASGAVVLAVCAGFQIAGEHFPGSDGHTHPGIGLLDVRTHPGTPRAVGDLAVEADPDLELPVLLGYENHAGRTEIGTGRPLGRVLRGVGNGVPTEPGLEGVVERQGAGLVVGTYLHGPVLAQNPALADLLLAHVAGALPALPIRDLGTATRALRQERMRSLRLTDNASTPPRG
jgi:CobQ-like glutamine amidotransferase family enzyme